MGEARLISVVLKFWLHKKNKFQISKVHLIDQFKVNYLPQGPYLNHVASKRGRGLKIPKIGYSAVPNKRTVWNNRGGYYTGLFGHARLI